MHSKYILIELTSLLIGQTLSALCVLEKVSASFRVLCRLKFSWIYIMKVSFFVLMHYDFVTGLNEALDTRQQTPYSCVEWLTSPDFITVAKNSTRDLLDDVYRMPIPHKEMDKDNNNCKRA